MKKTTQRKFLNLLALAIIFCKITICYSTKDFHTHKITSQNSFLYHQEIQIEKNDSSTINKTMKQALLNVFIKASGSPDINTNPIIAKSMDNPQSFISDHLIIKSNVSYSELLLSINFNSNNIENKLKEAGIKLIWDEFAPSVLLLIYFDDGEKPRILQNGDYFTQILNNHLNSRGIKTIYPLMDMQDLSNISTQDLRGLFLDKLTKTISRYGEPPVLIGYLEKNNSTNYQGRLRLTNTHKNHDIRFQKDTSLNNLKEKVSNLITTELLPLYSKDLTAKKSDFYIKVVGISTVNDINEIANQIKKSKIIADLYPHIIKNDEIVLHAFANSSVETTKSLLEDNLLFQENFNILPKDTKDDVSMCFEFIANNPDNSG